MSRIIPGMTKIYEGIQLFQDEVHDTKAELFQRLGKGQQPLVLFIGCSDSRINPNLLTQTEPGELFILRNAGNIVPPYGGGGGEEATIEYAVAGLKIRHIVLCGHSSCGAMHGLLEPGAVATMPSVARWLGHSKPIVSEVQQATAGLSPQNRLRLTIEKNVLLQIENLQTHPTVKAALDRGEIKLHPWVYDFATGEVQVHNRESNRFVSLGDRNVPGGKGPDGVETSTLPSNSM